MFERETKMAKKQTQNQKSNEKKDAPVYPVFKVVSKGVTIEWSDSLKMAQEAYKEAHKQDKQLWRVEETGAASLLQAA